VLNRAKKALFDIYAREKSGKELFRTNEKWSEPGLYEHFCESKGEKARIPLYKLRLFRYAALVDGLNGF
jgi:hypothetical protein